MSSYWDYVGDYISTPGSAISKGYAMYNRWVDDLHGGNRWLAYGVPIYGGLRYLQEQWQQYEDYYNNTGEDPLYGTKYGSYNSATGGATNVARSTLRMSRSLASLYPAEVKEDLTPKKTQMFRASREAADHWKSAWQVYNRRFD